MTLNTLKRRMARPGAGLFLKAFGTRLGSGSQRTAYRVGNYVVKANTCAWQMTEFPSAIREATKRVPRKALRAAGFRAPACWYAGKRREWVIMPYYTPVRHSPGMQAVFDDQFDDDMGAPDVEWQVAPDLTINLDVCARNSGVHPKGGFVAFDW